MGLAAPRKRRKLSSDPNNTTWSRATDNYGHRILAAQGWRPGDFLGARDANHASHYTTANASHIRVFLRDDNLGLGAQKGGANAETFGLDSFQDVLGRLNGKTILETQKDVQARRDIERRRYLGQKLGAGRFVSGGFLVGDTIQTEKPEAAPLEHADTVSTIWTANNRPKVDGATARPTKIKKKDKKKGSKGKPDSHSITAFSNSQIEDSSRMQQCKDQDLAEITKCKTTSTDALDTLSQTSHLKSGGASHDSKLARKTKKKAARMQRSEGARITAPSEQPNSQDVGFDIQPMHHSGELPLSTTQNSRYAVRQRYIKQKKKAIMDPQALREIFMTRT